MLYKYENLSIFLYLESMLLDKQNCSLYRSGGVKKIRPIAVYSYIASEWILFQKVVISARTMHASDITGNLKRVKNDMLQEIKQ